MQDGVVDDVGSHGGTGRARLHARAGLDVRVDPRLYGLWMSPSGEGWAVGESGTIMRRVP